MYKKLFKFIILRSHAKKLVVIIVSNQSKVALKNKTKFFQTFLLTSISSSFKDNCLFNINTAYTQIPNPILI